LLLPADARQPELPGGDLLKAKISKLQYFTDEFEYYILD